MHVQRQLAAVRERGMRAGLALNPATPLALIEEVVPDLDLVLVMSVNPGYGGQSYLPGCHRQDPPHAGAARPSPVPRHARGGRRASPPTTIADAWGAGADTFVAGTAVFGAADPAAAVRDLARRCAVSA